MRKVFVATLAILLFSAIAGAQNEKMKIEKKSFLALTAGPSFPFSDFGSTDKNNPDAGMARTGYMMSLRLAYQFDNIFGFAVHLDHGRHAVDNSYFNTSGATTGPWKFNSFLAGPMVTGTLSSRAKLDVSVLTGVALVRSPKVVRYHLVMLEDESSTTLPVKLSAAFRFRVNSLLYLFAGADCVYMRPEFPTNEETVFFRQNINVAGINGGIGIGF